VHSDERLQVPYEERLRPEDAVVLPDGRRGVIVGGPAPMFTKEDEKFYAVRVGGFLGAWTAEELRRV
jgi:hypothetical protein